MCDYYYSYDCYDDYYYDDVTSYATDYAVTDYCCGIIIPLVIICIVVPAVVVSQKKKKAALLA